LFQQESTPGVKNEVRAIKKLCNGSHENLVEVFDVGELALHAFIDMELCDGDLDDYNKSFWEHLAYHQSSKMQTQPIWNIMKQIASGLAFIHRKKEIHRDLKPKNGYRPKEASADIVVLYSRDSDTWKLTDFGLTSEGTSNGIRNTDASRGSPGYRAPELLQDNPTYNNKVDIWALGCILYELVTGQKLFLSDPVTFEQYNKALDISVDDQFDSSTLTIFKENIEEMLQKDPHRRPAAGPLFEKFCAYNHLLSRSAEQPVPVQPTEASAKKTLRELSIEAAIAKVKRNLQHESGTHEDYTVQSIIDVIVQLQASGRSLDAYEYLVLLTDWARAADIGGKPTDAFNLRHKVMELREGDVGAVETDVQMLENMRNLGIGYQKRGKWSESADILEKTLYCEMRVDAVSQSSKASTDEALEKAYRVMGLKTEALNKAAREIRIRKRFEEV
jgi:serine/threonine protein kinase